jgi:beta propeller repeat protein
MGAPPRLLLGSALALAALAAGAISADPRTPQPPEVVIRLRSDGARPESVDRLNRELGARGMRAVFRPSGRAGRATRAGVPDLSAVYRISLAPGSDAASAAARYAADPHVAWAHASVAMAPDLAADDPFLASSGSWGQPYRDLWGILRVRAPEAWDLTQGQGVVVAVIDTGIDTAHPDLAANLWVNPGEDVDHDGVVSPADSNGVDDDHNGFVDDLNGFDFANSEDADGDGDYDDPGDVSDPDPFDDFGHGTHVAGTIAAAANNGIGVAGVAPRARLMALKGFRASGETPDSVLARAMVYAADNGARVINNSWSCSVRCPTNPVLEEAQAYAAALGVTVVTSAGNRFDDVVFYSPKWRHDNVVVGATDDRDRPAVFTNTGFLVSVVAPGSGDFNASGIFIPQRAILSTRSSGAVLDADGGGVFTVGGEYLRWVGTSMSAPHVSGIAALILALHPDFTPDEVRAVVRGSARDLGDPGFDRVTASGLADAAAAAASPRPSVRAQFAAPVPGANVVPDAETVVIRGVVIGSVVDAVLSVGFGRDPSSFEPIPLVSPLPEAEGELARWDVSGRDDGSYVLRLEVRGADGATALEFLPLVLERNVPRRLSSPGAPARAPAIAGGRVVWESDRPADGAPLGLELFATDWSTGEEQRVVSAPGDQRAARLSGDRLAWIDARASASEIGTCRIDRRGSCRVQIAAPGPERRTGLDVSADTLVWSEGDSGAEKLRACRVRSAGCNALPVPASTRSQLDPLLRGSRLWWIEFAPGSSVVHTCADFPERCTPTAIEIARPDDRFAASATRLVWWQLFNAIFLCTIVDSSTCVPRPVMAVEAEIDLALSEQRLVWSAPGPGGDFDVYFCEDDSLTSACPVQRITSSIADQRHPAVSGPRVVWEDERDGVTAIAGLELPSLDRVADRRAAVGQPLRIAVRGRDPSGGALALSAVFADGTPLAARGASFTDRGDGTGLLLWTPRAQDVGRNVITFAGRSAGRLTTRTSALVEVSSPRAAP